MICVAVGHHSRLEIHSMSNFLKLNDAKLVMKIEDLFSDFVSRQIISRYYWKVLLPTEARQRQEIAAMKKQYEELAAQVKVHHQAWVDYSNTAKQKLSESKESITAARTEAKKYKDEASQAVAQGLMMQAEVHAGRCQEGHAPDSWWGHEDYEEGDQWEDEEE